MKELKQIGKNIADLRRKKGMSQLDLAVKCEVQELTISRIENGRTNPTVRTLLKIAKALGVPLSELVRVK